MKTSATLYVANMVEQHTAATITVSSSLMMNELQTTFNRLYLRVGRLVIRPYLAFTLTEDRSTLHSMLTCFAIFLRFIRTQNSVKDNSSPNRRLLGLERYWLKKYETYTIENLLKELFGTLYLQNTLIYQRALLLKIDFSRSVHSIIQGLLQTEFRYIDVLKSSLPRTFKNSDLQSISLLGYLRAISALNNRAS